MTSYTNFPNGINVGTSGVTGSLYGTADYASAVSGTASEGTIGSAVKVQGEVVQTSNDGGTITLTNGVVDLAFGTAGALTLASLTSVAYAQQLVFVKSGTAAVTLNYADGYNGSTATVVGGGATAVLGGTADGSLTLMGVAGAWYVTSKVSVTLS